AMRRLVPGHPLVFLGAGRDPGPQERRRMRDAGVQVPIFDPVDLHTLRFQMNRALASARPVRGRRSTLRAPADFPVVVRGRAARQKEGRIYTISASGAFVSMGHPTLVRSHVTLRTTIPGVGPATLPGRVVMTNVPGNLMRRNLPHGMGVRFEDLNEAVAVALVVYAQERLRTLVM